MSALQTKIIELMIKDASISAEIIAAMIGITSRHVERNISSLKKAGLIERVGPAKGGRWAVKKTE